MEVHEGHLSLPVLSLLVLGGCCLRPLAPCFQPLEQTITTVTPNVFGHGMEYHHHSYTQRFQPRNGTSPPQLHPTLSATEWNITTTVTHNDQLAWTLSVPVSQWSLSADFNSSTPVTQCQRHILTGTTDMFTTLTHLAPGRLSPPTLLLYCQTPDCLEAAS